MIKKHKKLFTVLFVILNIAIIAIIAFTEFGGKSGGDVAPSFASNWYIWLLCALGCLGIVILAETVKYAYMMHCLGEKVSWKAAFETSALGKYYDCITPSGAGGQPFQIYWMHKAGYSDGTASSVPIIGFITMQAGFIITAIICFIAYRSVGLEAIRITAYIGLVFYAFVPCLLVAFSLCPKVTKKVITWFINLGAKIHLIKKPEDTVNKVMGSLEQFHSSFKLISVKKGSILVLLLLSVIYQVAICSLPYFVLLMLGGSGSYFELLATTAYIYAAVTLIVTPGNSGAAEGAFYLVFSSIGTAGVFWAMIIWRLLCYYSFILIGALIYLINFIVSKIKQKKDKEAIS